MIISGVIIICCTFIVIRWVKGIDYMKKNYPDYKGEDFLGESL